MLLYLLSSFMYLKDQLLNKVMQPSVPPGCFFISCVFLFFQILFVHIHKQKFKFFSPLITAYCEII